MAKYFLMEILKKQNSHPILYTQTQTSIYCGKGKQKQEAKYEKFGENVTQGN